MLQRPPGKGLEDIGRPSHGSGLRLSLEGLFLFGEGFWRHDMLAKPRNSLRRMLARIQPQRQGGQQSQVLGSPVRFVGARERPRCVCRVDTSFASLEDGALSDPFSSRCRPA